MNLFFREMTVSHNLGLSASDIAVAGSNPARHSGTAEIFEGVNNFAQWVPARHIGLKEVETYPVFWFNRVCLHLCIGENRKKVILIILQCTTCIKGNNDNLPCSNQTF